MGDTLLIAVDPSAGAGGTTAVVAATYAPLAVVETEVYAGADAPWQQGGLLLDGLIARHRATRVVVVVEAPFLGKDARAAMGLAAAMGGWKARALDRGALVLTPMASEWRVVLREHFRGRRMPRADAGWKALACEYAAAVHGLHVGHHVAEAIGLLRYGARQAIEQPSWVDDGLALLSEA